MSQVEIKTILEEKCGLDASRPLVAAFSGGADSLALLILLKQAGLNVFAAHFNHHLRENAGQDVEAARRMAEYLSIPFLYGESNVPAIVNEQKISVEEAARNARYRWLLGQADEIGAQVVAVAHTADDQVETILMHLLRGSGLDGLTGMPYRQIFPLWNRDIPVVRPLLSIWRMDTEAICRSSGILPVMDESNKSTRYFRNRIRLELIPYLQEYNPQVKNHLLQTAKVLSDDQMILESLKHSAWQDCFKNRSTCWIAFNCAKLSDQPEGLLRYVLRQGLLELDPQVRDIDFSQTDRLSRFVHQMTRSGEMHLFNNFWVQHTGDRLILWLGKPGLAAMYPQLEPDMGVEIPCSGRVEFADGYLEAAEMDIDAARGQILDKQTENIVFLDLERLHFPLILRTPRPGERFAPLGMGGKTQKLSDYFTNRKVPRQARENWPLVVSGSDVIWVVASGISQSAAITPETRRVLRLSFQIQIPRPTDSI